jgi:intracellular sulfur oxidation DsrE/DsrF family protein
MIKNRKLSLAQSVVLAGVFLGSTAAFAGREHDHVGAYLDTCENLPLVNTLIGGPENTSVCVDAPVALKKAKVVFNMDAPVMDASGNPVGLRHLWMLGTALQARIKAGLLDPEEVSIIGIFHGTSTPWALKNSPMAGWIEKIFALKNQGVNINLEMCGVTMLGKGLTNANLYSSENGVIHVNQGAIGRMVDLEQNGYAYIQEE